MTRLPRIGFFLLCAFSTAVAADESWTARFEDELATQEWTLIKSDIIPAWQPPGASNAVPLEFKLVDSASGQKATLRTSAFFTSDTRLRWGGRTLGVDWVLVLDGATGETATVSGQLKSGMTRVLRLEASAKEQGVLLASDPQQPRIHERTTDPETGGSGLNYFLRVEPGVYGGRASFRFSISAPTNGEAFIGPRPLRSPGQGWAGEDPELKATMAALIRARLAGTADGNPAPLPGLRRTDEPVFAAVDQQTVASIESETELEVILHNLTDRTQPVTITGHGDFAVPTLSFELPPAASRIETLPVHSMEPATGTVLVVVEASGFQCLEIPIPVIFLPPDENLLRDSRVKIEVDSAMSGYRSTGLADGRIPVGDSPEERAYSWSSDESVAAHWVRIAFPQPTAVSELKLLWHNLNGRPLVPQAGELTGWTASGERVPLAKIDMPPVENETRIEFETIQLKTLEWRQPVGAGSQRRPNLLWLNELEVR